MSDTPPGYKPPPSVKTQLPDATIGPLPRMGGGTVTPAPPVAPPVAPPAAGAAPVTPAAGAGAAPVTPAAGAGAAPVTPYPGAVTAPVTPAAGAVTAPLTKQQKLLKMMQDAAAAIEAKAAEEAAMDAELQKYLLRKTTTPEEPDPLQYKAGGQQKK